MSLPSVLEPLLKKYDLMALLTNEGWLLIRRKCYIDIYIKDEPYSSVEVLYHTLSKRIIVRLWGRTIHNQPGDIAQEVKKAFSNKPCFGICIQNHSIDIDNIDNLLEKEYPTPRYISTACNTWSEETYEKNKNFNPATCQSCKNNLIKHEETTCEEGIEAAGIKQFRHSNDSGEDNEFKRNTQLCPPGNKVDDPKLDDIEVEDNALHEVEEGRGVIESYQPQSQLLHDLPATPQRINISPEDLKTSTIDTKDHPEMFDHAEEKPFGSGSGANMIKKETDICHQDYISDNSHGHEDKEIKMGTQLCPPNDEVDDIPHCGLSTKVLLAKLYRDSNIAKCKTNQVKRDKWQNIAEEYCRQKNIPLIDHTKLARRWWRIVAVAQKKKSNAEKFASATGGDAPYATLDQDNELVLSAAEADADLPSTDAWIQDYISENLDKAKTNEKHHIKAGLLLDMERELKEIIKMEENDMPITQQSKKPSSLSLKEKERKRLIADNLGGRIDKEELECDEVQSSTKVLGDNDQEPKDNRHRRICDLRKCPYCDRTFTKNSVYFQTHLKQVHFSGVFKCKVCGFTAEFARDLVKHMNENCKHHDPLTKCPNCRQKISFEEIEGHFKECVGKSHSKRKKIMIEAIKARTVCPLCGKNVTVGSLPTHMQLHKREQRLKEGESMTSLDYFCEKCGMKFKWPRSLQWHMKNMHSEKPIPCPDCDLEFATIGKMKHHQAKHHKPKLQCQHCDYKAHNNEALNNHTAKHFDPTFKCDQCGNMYPTKGSLRWHVKLKHEGYVAKGTKA